MQAISLRKSKKLDAPFTLILTVFSAVGLFPNNKSHFINHDGMVKSLLFLNRNRDYLTFPKQNYYLTKLFVDTFTPV